MSSIHGFILALRIVLLVLTNSSAFAQDKPIEFVPREQLIFAIVHYAYSGGCETLRNVYGTVFDSVCHDPHRTSGFAEHMFAFGLLRCQQDEALIEICRRNKITDCVKLREASKGRQVLTLKSSVDLGLIATFHPTWSPDNRFLLVDNLPKGEIRLLDVDRGQLLDPPIYTGPPLNAAAWSPDGNYLAFSDRKRAYADQQPPIGGVRLYSSGTFEQLAIFAYSKGGCSPGSSGAMAFTPDSRAIWLACGSTKLPPAAKSPRSNHLACAQNRHCIRLSKWTALAGVAPHNG